MLYHTLEHSQNPKLKFENMFSFKEQFQEPPDQY